MSDTEHIKKFNWREAMKLIERKLVEMEARTRELEVLVVDDDVNDVILLERQLKNFCCNVTICHDSIEASQILRTKSFDIAFIDQKMPKLTGLELIQNSLPEGKLATNFVVVTGFSDSPLLEQTLKLGAVLAPKPLTREKLTMFLRLKDE